MKNAIFFTVLFFSFTLLSSFKVVESKTQQEKLIAALLSSPAACELKGLKLYGKIQFVTSHPDLKIQYVDSYADINVQMVTFSPTVCGQWQEVSSGADLKVQIVNSFPDLKVKLVTSSPGMN